MRISEFVLSLMQVQAEHGDLEVDTLSAMGIRQPHLGPKVDFRAVAENKPGQWPSFATRFTLPEQIGEKVCRI